MAYLKASVLSRLPEHVGGCFAFSEGSTGGMGKWVQGTGGQQNRMEIHSDCWTHDLDLVLCSVLWDGSLTSRLILESGQCCDFTQRVKPSWDSFLLVWFWVTSLK